MDKFVIRKPMPAQKAPQVAPTPLTVDLVSKDAGAKTPLSVDSSKKRPIIDVEEHHTMQIQSSKLTKRVHSSMPGKESVFDTIMSKPTAAPNLSKPKAAAKPKKTKSTKKKAKADSFKTVTKVPVPMAQYQDESLYFVTLQDGSEVVVGAEVSVIEANGTKVRTLEQQKGDIGRSAPLPGLDAIAVLPFRSKTIKILSLPGTQEISTVELENRNPSHRISCMDAILNDDGTVTLLVTDVESSFWILKIGKNQDEAKYQGGRLIPRLVQSGDLRSRKTEGSLRSAKLYRNSSGTLFALMGMGEMAYSFRLNATNDSIILDGEPERVMELHYIRKKSDKSAWIGDMAIWYPKDDAGPHVVSVGSDGFVRVTALEGSSKYEDEWHCTSRGSGGSKGYPYAPAHYVAVSNKYGVAMTGCYYENAVHFYDLTSKKSSANGKRVCKRGSLASGRRVDLMCVAASELSGVFAYSCSNREDDPTLNLLVPK